MKYFKKISALLIVILTNTFVFSQDLEWVKTMGGSLYDEGKTIALDESGNVYLTGSFFGTVDFDPGIGTTNLSSNGSFDVFIQKFDASGNFIWAKSIGGTGQDVGYSITLDEIGNCYITGEFESTVDFNPGIGITNLTSNGLRDIFILKLGINGSFLWAKSTGGTSFDAGYSVKLDEFGSIYTAGSFVGTVDFDPGIGSTFLTSTGGYNGFIQKLDASGNFLWAKSITIVGFDIAKMNAMSIDAVGSVYTSGYFTGTVDFDPGVGTTNLTSNGGDDTFIQKLDINGDFLWAKSLGGISSDWENSITLDAAGNCYVTGGFRGAVDFDPGAGTTILTSNGNEDIFILKLDVNGNFLWVKSMGGNGEDVGKSTTIDATGSIYTTGTFTGTVDFDPGIGITNITSTGNEDIFIQKLDTNGYFIWVKTFGEYSNDIGNSILIDAEGSIYTTGYFSGTTDFDPGPGVTNMISNGNNDIFILKLSQCIATIGTDTQSACNSYTWIDGVTYNSDNTTATHILTNVAGCDSTVTLNLTISQVNINASQSGPVLTAESAGVGITYQWLDCNDNNAPISGETNQTFVTTSNGGYRVEINDNGCVDTSVCLVVTGLSIIQNLFEQNILIYPNPSNDEINIDLKGLEGAQILIYNLAGQCVFKEINSQTNFYKVGLESGTYIIEINTNKQNFKKKILIL